MHAHYTYKETTKSWSIHTYTETTISLADFDLRHTLQSCTCGALNDLNMMRSNSYSCTNPVSDQLLISAVKTAVVSRPRRRMCSTWPRRSSSKLKTHKHRIQFLVITAISKINIAVWHAQHNVMNFTDIEHVYIDYQAWENIPQCKYM